MRITLRQRLTAPFTEVENLDTKETSFLRDVENLQSNGSKSAKRCLKRISGKERRHVKEMNHIVSKSIVKKAVQDGAKVIVLEDLTNIRNKIKKNKRT